MVITLFFWTITFIIISMAGWLVISILERFFKKPTGSIHPVLTFLVGLFFITFFSDIISLFQPLDKNFFFCLAAGAVLIGIFRIVKNHRWPIINITRPTLLQALVILLGLFLFIIVLDLSSRLPANADTAIYHAQAIHWIEAFPAVPGLGNLHSRLAYNSNWLVDNAVFSFSWTGRGAPYHILPGLLAILSLFYFLGGLWQFANHRGSSANFLKILLIPAFFVVSPSEVSSPGTDLPVIFFTWIILCESLDGIWTANPDNEGKQLLLACLAVFAATLKLSVAPLLLLPGILVVLYLHQKNYSWVFKFFFTACLILGAWMARNCVISGYLVYPLPQIDFFTFDWKIPSVVANIEINSISNWARHIWINSDQHSNSLPIQEWAPLWFKAETLNRQVMVGFAALGILVYSILFLFRPTRHWLKKLVGDHFLSTQLVSFAGCLYWFLSAPDFRFGYSFILFSILLMILPIYAWLSSLRSKWNGVLTLLLALSLLVYQSIFYINSFQSESYTTRLVNLEPYPTSPTSSCRFGNFSAWCAEIYNQCWYNPFPCVPRPLEGVNKRGNDLKDGFWDNNLFH